jgi:hypothetical protein
MKISDIDNIALDRWVAKAEGLEVRYSNTGAFWRLLGEIDEVQWLPHRDWMQAGPIIEREKIAIFPNGEQWSALAGRDVEHFTGGDSDLAYVGSTPLIAAMRCYVAQRFSSEELQNN